MFKRLDVLLFHYKLFSNLYKYVDPKHIEEQQLLSFLKKKFKQKIILFLDKNKIELTFEYYLNLIKDENSDFENKKSKYIYYLNLLKNNEKSLEIYYTAKKIFRNNNLDFENEINTRFSKIQPIKYSDTRYINIKNNIYLKLINNIFTCKSTLLIIVLFLLNIILFNILLNTFNIADSISEHGTISNMVDLHSSFAITTKIIMIINFTFCLIFIVAWFITLYYEEYKNIFKNVFILNLGQLYFVLYIVSLIYSLYFAFTGFVWAEFTWGGRIWKFESKMIQLWIHIALNTLFCFIFFFYRKKNFFFILNLVFIISIVSFIFFSFYSNIDQPYSVHQSTDSLHLFLRFVGAGTGYYVVIFVLYLFYLVFTCLIMQYECLQLIVKKPVLKFYSKFIN